MKNKEKKIFEEPKTHQNECPMIVGHDGVLECKISIHLKIEKKNYVQ